MLLTSAIWKENSAISLEEWVLVLKVFTTAIRKLRVNQNHLSQDNQVIIFAITFVYKDLNYVQMILNKPLYCFFFFKNHVNVLEIFKNYKLHRKRTIVYL